MNFRLMEFNNVRLVAGQMLPAWTSQRTMANSTGCGCQSRTSKNVMLFGPHLGLLEAATRYMMTPAHLVESWRAGGDKRFLNAMDPVRSRDGYWLHPDWPVLDRKAKTRKNAPG